MNRSFWQVIISLVIGVGLGLIISWGVAPMKLTETDPSVLRVDFKDHFREVIAASYASNGNLPRAQARLELLGDDDTINTLNSQAQRALANGNLTQGNQLAALAIAIDDKEFVSSPIQTTTPNEVPTSNFQTQVGITTTPDQQLIETAIPTFNSLSQTIFTLTPRPTRTPIPTIGAPFRITSEETTCDPNLPDGILQVFVYNSNRRQMPGIQIIINWDTGSDTFFTGLKPELGNGYADFQMEDGTAYSVQLAIGSDTATNLIPPSCQTFNGTTFTGGFKIVFQQP